MKRFTHAWISLMAINRLKKIADDVKEPLKTNVMSLYKFLNDERRKPFVVEGSWLPDNVIRDNLSQGHTWKYSPPYYHCIYQNPKIRVDHNTTDVINSISKSLAQKSYMWDKKWVKNDGDGILPDRCQALQLMMRDLFLLREDEMHDIASTLCEYLSNGDNDWEPPEVFSKEEKLKVSEFLFDPSKVSSFYDKMFKDEVKYDTTRKKRLRKYKRERKRYTNKIIETFREKIDMYITRNIGLKYNIHESSMFPLYCHGDQIALHLFSLSHYIADAHVPMHCDIRPFSHGECDIHGEVEKEWERWIVSNSKEKELNNVLSEYERGQNFIEYIENSDGSFHFPISSPLYWIENDDNICKKVWENRRILFSSIEEQKTWDDIVGTCYISYCFSNLLFTSNDNMVVFPYIANPNFPNLPCDVYGNSYGQVKMIQRKQWKEGISPIDQNFIDSILDGNGSTINTLFNLVKKYKTDMKEVSSYVYGLAILLDSVDMVAITWAKICDDHLRICNSNIIEPY